MLRYISHPNVSVNSSIPVPQWGLSDTGRQRAERMLHQPWVAALTRVVSSDETKAVETAEILAGHLGLSVEIRAGLGENDRSATGFVPPAQFERLADAFFANPHESVRGWERAIDAQARIVSGLEDLVTAATSTTNTEIAVVGHGGVGTLWFCHLSGLAIDRAHDQPGQGHYFTFDPESSTVLHPWRPVDDIEVTIQP